MEQTPAARFVDVLGRLGYKTQQQIADLLQIARPTAGTIVRQEREPSFSDVARLKSEHDEVNIDWIFTGKGQALGRALTPSNQLPPQVPSKVEPAKPEPTPQPTMAIASDGELYWRGLATERLGTINFLKELLRAANGMPQPDATEENGADTAAPKKQTGSEQAAEKVEQEERLMVHGLVRYPAVIPAGKYAWVDEALATPLATRVAQMWKSA